MAAPSHVVRFIGQIGIVTPYFEAVPLRLLKVAANEKQSPFPVPIATKIALDALDGLCQYHALDGKLCGGVCPDHLLVGTDGDTRVGNVAVPAISPKESPWRGRVERLAYLAPEQLTTARRSDARTDVYAVGVVLWEMIANQPKMFGSPAQILESLRDAKGLPALSPLDESKLSPHFLATLGRALHPDPAERHPSVGAFARELLEAGEEPAAASDVATFVEKVARQSLQSLRTAIALQQIQTIKQGRSSKSGSLPGLETTSQPAAARTSIAGRASRLESFPPNSDHTAVFKVTAELLQKARGDSTPSEPKQRVSTRVTAEEYSGGERTVTFEVPEDLLEEARSLFQATEQAASSSESKVSAPPSGPGNQENANSDATLPCVPLDECEVRTTDQQHSEALLRKLRSDVPALAKPAIPRIDEDATTIWRPHGSSEPAKLETQKAPAPKVPPPAPNRIEYWFLGLIISVVVAALTVLVAGAASK